MKPINFTPAEWEIIVHRLSASDVIAECLADVVDENGVLVEWYDFETTEKRCLDISRNGQTAINWSSQHDRDIVEDAITGSMYCCDLLDAVAFGEITRGKYLAIMKAAKSIESKTGLSLGGI